MLATACPGFVSDNPSNNTSPSSSGFYGNSSVPKTSSSYSYSIPPISPTFPVTGNQLPFLFISYLFSIAITVSVLTRGIDIILTIISAMVLFTVVFCRNVYVIILFHGSLLIPVISSVVFGAMAFYWCLNLTVLLYRRLVFAFLITLNAVDNLAFGKSSTQQQCLGHNFSYPPKLIILHLCHPCNTLEFQWLPELYRGTKKPLLR